MKTYKIGGLALFLVFGLIIPAQAYNITIYNPTDCVIEVILFEHHLEPYSSSIVIDSHSRYTFKTGWWCPIGLNGYILPSETVIVPTCLGPLREGNDICCPNCKSSEWTIVQNDDGTWHFRKGNHTSGRPYEHPDKEPEE